MPSMRNTAADDSSSDVFDARNIHTSAFPPRAPAQRLEEPPGDTKTDNSVGNLDDDDSNQGPPRRKRSSVAGLSSRTGQACDRCKRRKIRCDNSPGGCLPCQQNHTECKTTDRNTGRATGRGHTEQVERELLYYRQRVPALESQIRELGGEPVAPAPSAATSFDSGYNNAEYEQVHTWAASTPTAEPQSAYRLQDSNAFPSQHSRRSGEAGGQQQQQQPPPPLSALPAVADLRLQGMVLSLFGMDVDIAQCMPTYYKDKGDQRSYETMLEYCRKGPEGGRRGVAVDLGPHQECLKHVEWYLSNLNLWMPFLHPPDILRLVTKTYEEGYEPDCAETVILHMVQALMKYQIAVRNRPHDPGLDGEAESDRHYLYALTFFQDLAKRGSLQDVQALCLIYAHTRGFPSPVTASYLQSQILPIMVANGLHRSTESWPKSETRPDKLTTELRKRVFWSFLLLAVPNSGRLGHPMPLEVKDFDIEIPEPMDFGPHAAASGPSRDGGRLFVPIAFHKLTSLFIEAYSAINAVRRLEDHDKRLSQLVEKVRAWKKNDWPEYLKGPRDQLPQDERGLHVIAAWLEYYSTELLLLLHFPATRKALTADALVKDLRVSIDLSSQLIQVTFDLWRFKIMDTAWSSNMKFIAAIFTLLYCLDAQLDYGLTISSDAFSTLKSQIYDCLKITEDIGHMLGSGTRLAYKMKTIIDSSMDKLMKKVIQRTASSAVVESDTYGSPLSLHLNRQGRPESGTSPRTKVESQDGHPSQAIATYHPQHHPSTPQHGPPQPQNISPITGYQQAPNGTPYQYQTYAGDQAGFQGNQNYIYAQPPPVYTTQPAASMQNAWTQYMDPPMASDSNNETAANALVSLGQTGNSVHASQQHLAMSYTPNLLPPNRPDAQMSQGEWSGVNWSVGEEERRRLQHHQ